MSVEGSTNSLLFFFVLSRHILDGTDENHRNSRFKPGLSEYQEEILRTQPRDFQVCARNSRAKHTTNALRTKYEAVHMAAYICVCNNKGGGGGY